MRNGVKHSILMVVSILVSFTGMHAAPVSIIFSDGVRLAIHKVETAEGDLQSWKGNENPLKSLFYTYNFPSSVDAYKQLFYQQSFPSHIDEVYTEWQQKMSSVVVSVQAIYYGALDGQEIACIQFNFTQPGGKLQMGFLAKRMEGKWYPVTTTENAKYQQVMALCATLTPGMVSAMLNPDPQSTFNVAAKEIINSCSADGRNLTEACLYSIAEKWGTSESPVDLEKEKMLFKNRVEDNLDADRKANLEQAVNVYIQSLTIPEEGKKKAEYYFRKNEGMKAITVLYEFGLDKERKQLFDELNQVQQTSQYKSFVYEVPEKPKSN